jgi:CRISPR system Cascade subunit CasE
VSTLYIWKVVLDARALSSFAREQSLLHRDIDQGYLAHAALAAVFGDAAPKPFAIERSLSPDVFGVQDGLVSECVLAYSEHMLERRSAAHEHAHLVQWDRSGSKQVPTIAEGTRLGFITRMMPTVRTRAAAPGHPAHGRGEGREVDAFLAECFRVGEGVKVDRAAVYRDWLARQMRGMAVGVGGAELEDYSLRAFRRIHLMRREVSRGEGRKRHVLERPDAIVTGTLRVTDTTAFRALLARGIGRHRAFGFGMLLVRRAG